MNNTVMLKKNKEFKYVFLRGKIYIGKYIEIFIIKNNSNINKIGLAISKHIGKSTVRNRIKRLFRENYRLMEKNLKTGYTLVFLWKKNVPVDKANFHLIKKDMEAIFRKANILI